MNKLYWTLDVGNTRWKVCVFQDEKPVKTLSVSAGEAMPALEELAKEYPIYRGIVSATGAFPDRHHPFFKPSRWIWLGESKKDLHFLFDNGYRTPGTLGEDRLALMSACQYFEGGNTLVIDAGTCITYDYLDEKSKYCGGAISPGIRSRYRALHDYTANLPLLKKKNPENITGNDTESSIHSGVIHGIIFEIQGVIDSYRNTYGTGMKVILTGGDAKFLANLLKSNIFVRPNFLMEGLWVILKTNMDDT